MSVSKEDVSAEQVKRMLVAADQPYIQIEAMKPPYPDVRVTLAGGKVAAETTEVHAEVGPTGGSPSRGPEERAIRAGLITTGFGVADPIPGIIRAIESKCGKTAYRLDGDEDGFWLVLLGSSTAAPRSTMILTVFLDLERLTQLSHGLLSGSRFTHCYLFCELTERGRAFYAPGCCRPRRRRRSRRCRPDRRHETAQRVVDVLDGRGLSRGGRGEKQRAGEGQDDGDDSAERPAAARAIRHWQAL